MGGKKRLPDINDVRFRHLSLCRSPSLTSIQWHWHSIPPPTLEKWMNFRKPFSPRFQRERIFHYSTFSATGKSEHKIKRTIFQIKSFFFGSSSNKLCTAKLFRDGFVLISGLGENWNELLLLIVFAVSFFLEKNARNRYVASHPADRVEKKNRKEWKIRSRNCFSFGFMFAGAKLENLLSRRWQIVLLASLPFAVPLDLDPHKPAFAI